MAKKVKAVKKLGGKKNAKYYVSDANDRDFRANGIDLVLEAGVRKEVSAEQAKLLQKEYPYLKVEVV